MKVINQSLLYVQEFFHAVSLNVIERLSSPTAVAFSRQHLANTVWAFATIEYEGGSYFLSKLARALTLRAGDCNPQEISNTVWAFAKLREVLIPTCTSLFCYLSVSLIGKTSSPASAPCFEAFCGTIMQAI